jgi:hypothetical protein
MNCVVEISIGDRVRVKVGGQLVMARVTQLVGDDLVKCIIPTMSMQEPYTLERRRVVEVVEKFKLW